ncbi:hypothetical protein BRC81_12295 [Halobacteriales archaeon QS_1_68_20]|nr:MAG: hypothetical protein BRC81_12295 [Halobacteriales archaeon QS_1_68_20]
MREVDPLVTHRLPDAGEPETCTDVVACAATDVTALVLGAAILLVAIFVAAVAHVRSARSVTSDERERVRREAKAFTAFADRITDLEAGPAGGSPRRVGTATLVESTTTTSLQDVADAYRETVMAVPHYESEYGEPLAQNMAAEFGDDVASAVVTGQNLTPQLKRTLLQRSARAQRLRLALLEHLDAEAEAVAEAEADFDRISDSVDRIEEASLEDATFEDLLAEWYLLEDRERECVERLQTRQKTIQDRRGLSKHLSEAPTLEQYLYAPLDVTYPVLADGTTLLDRIRAAQHDVLYALGSVEGG